jgi:hypothetical protein
VILAIAVSLGAIGLLLARVHDQRVWSAVVPSRAPVGAFIGDAIVVRPFAPTHVTIISGIFHVTSGLATPAKPFVFRSTGADSYYVRTSADRATRVDLYRAEPDTPPFVIGLLFIAAFGLTVYAASKALPGTETVALADPRTVAAIWAASSALMYLLTPHEYHNDTIGGDQWRNWGYLGFGYIDTMQAVAVGAMHHGLNGLIDAQSMGKPIAYQAMAALLGAAALPTILPAGISCIGMGGAVAATYVIGRLLGSERVGWVAAGLFAVSPVVLQYAGAFYQESGYLAAACWSFALTVHAVKNGSARSLGYAALLAAIAVSSKQVLTAPLIAAFDALVILAAGASWRKAASIALLQCVAAIAGLIALWPFLWKDTSHRLAFVWGERIAFDAFIGVSLPLGQRILIAIGQDLGHCGPAVLVLMAIGLWAGLVRRHAVAAWCSLGVLIGITFVVPTSLYLQHYLLFAYPFVPLLAAFGLDSLPLDSRTFARAGAIAVAADVAWAAWFLPYPGAAAIGCLDFACTARVYGVAEPTYGLANAARWLDANSRPGDAVGALTSPHILQAELPGRPVLHLFWVPRVRAQEAELRSTPVKFVVANAWSDANDEQILTPSLHLVWTGSPREGSPHVYESDNAAPAGVPDVPPDPQSVLSLVPAGASRIIVTGHRDQYVAAFGENQVVLPLPSDSDVSNGTFADILGLGGGIAVVGEDSELRQALASFEQPLASNADAATFALPTLDSYRVLAPLRFAPAKRPGRIGLDITIPATTSQAAFDDGLRADITLDRPIGQSGHARISLSCLFNQRVDAAVFWLGPTHMRALVPLTERPLSDCVSYHVRIVAHADIWPASARRTPQVHVTSATIGYAWDSSAADALTGAPVPTALVTFGGARSVGAVWRGNDVLAFLRRSDKAALVTAVSDRRFREFADSVTPLSASTDLLLFSRNRVPAAVPAGDY